MKIECADVAETMAVGRRLAPLLRPGDVVLLAGRLGAGKTVFVSGIAEGLGIDAPITSPSFVLVRTYQGFLGMTHADAYRLGSFGELWDLGLEETVGDGVLVVEWGNVVDSAFGEDALVVNIEVGSDDARTISFEARGSWRARALEELA
ncbi:MAG: tRNA (adenosine(37)-N6)-threonylcarbamoyltransferase complex ATPase subunit type 1 TsaE [Acidimicrobiia bacterium]|nr:tRNA (adenosine(37)-N6)-threonylcarbamoyltransferase complex ATPase subunit type 1 TsaE [Acidimicrobiia bacterium]